MSLHSSPDTGSKIDLSELIKKRAQMPRFDFNATAKEYVDIKALTGMMGKKLPPKQSKKKTRAQKLAGPWKYDFKNNCVKCNRAYHLQRHHITYDPPIIVYLCETCHKRITGLNTRAARLVGTSKFYKPVYTNIVRVKLWRWFMSNQWPVDEKNKPVRRLSKTLVLNILLKESNPSGTKRDNAGERLTKNTGSISSDIGLYI